MSSTRFFQAGTILLDRPLVDYFSRIRRKHRVQRGGVRVEFLCGPHSAAHLVTILENFRIPYHFLDIPVDEWKEYKSRPEYEGD